MVDADLVLLDLHMPHRDGFAIMAQLRDALPDDAFVPVLVLTADTTTQARDRALSVGAKDFLTKPFDRAEVVLRVRNLLETRVLYADLQPSNAVLQTDLRLRPDIVKLDIALIRGIHENAARRALASAMVTFAREIDAVIVAEGVETHEELAALRSLAVTWGSGVPPRHARRAAAAGVAPGCAAHAFGQRDGARGPARGVSVPAA